MVAKKHTFICGEDGEKITSWSAQEFPSLVAAHQATHEAPPAEPPAPKRQTKRLKEDPK